MDEAPKIKGLNLLLVGAFLTWLTGQSPDVPPPGPQPPPGPTPIPVVVIPSDLEPYAHELANKMSDNEKAAKLFANLYLSMAESLGKSVNLVTVSDLREWNMQIGPLLKAKEPSPGKIVHSSVVDRAIFSGLGVPLKDGEYPDVYLGDGEKIKAVFAELSQACEVAANARIPNTATNP